MAPCILLGLRAPLRAPVFCIACGGWHAASRTREIVAYRVHEDEDGALRCECPGFGYRSTCAHVEAVGALSPGESPVSPSTWFARDPLERVPQESPPSAEASNPSESNPAHLSADHETARR